MSAAVPVSLSAGALSRLLLAGLLMAGLSLQALAWLMALSGSSDNWGLVLVAHAMSAPLLAAGVWPWLPPTLREPAIGMLALLASLCMALPGLGPIMLVLGVWRLRRPCAIDDPMTNVNSIDLPTFDGNLGHATDLRVLGMGPRALHSPMPTAKRLQALMSLEALPSALSTGLLRDALRDSEDEVRLVAYTVMDQQEQQLTRQIQDWQAQLQTTTDPLQTLRLRRHLVELHLELLHRDLAQGDWRQILLSHASDLAEQWVQTHPDDAIAHLYWGRLLWLQGKRSPARSHLVRASALGAPPSRTWPYLAELALADRNPALVRHWLAQLDEATLSPRLRRLRDFWSANDHA